MTSCNVFWLAPFVSVISASAMACVTVTCLTSELWKLWLLKSCLHLFLCMRWMTQGACTGWLEDNLSKSLLSSHQVGPQDLTQSHIEESTWNPWATSPAHRVKNLFGIWSCISHALWNYFFCLCFTFIDMAACPSSLHINHTSILVSKSYVLKPADLNWFHMFMVKSPFNMLPSLPC